MFTLAQLRCFSAVAEELNFRRAAQRLNMTQPPLTRQIQALEQEVGAALLDRSGKTTRLTPAGRSFADAARRLLAEAAEAALEVRRIARGEAGSLTIGFTAASSYVYLPRLVALLRARLPEVALTLRELTTPQQLVALRAQQIEIGLLRPPVALAGIRTMPAYREKLLLAVPRDHALASAPTVGLADLAGEMLITFPPIEGPYFHNLIIGLLRVAGVAPGAVQYITQTHSILALVGGGFGVAIVPQSADRFAPADIVLRPLEGTEGVTADLVLAWRDGADNPACERALRLAAGLG